MKKNSRLSFDINNKLQLFKEGCYISKIQSCQSIGKDRFESYQNILNFMNNCKNLKMKKTSEYDKNGARKFLESKDKALQKLELNDEIIHKEENIINKRSKKRTKSCRVLKYYNKPNNYKKRQPNKNNNNNKNIDFEDDLSPISPIIKNNNSDDSGLLGYSFEAKDFIKEKSKRRYTCKQLFQHSGENTNPINFTCLLNNNKK